MVYDGWSLVNDLKLTNATLGKEMIMEMLVLVVDARFSYYSLQISWITFTSDGVSVSFTTSP
jgi:hypothetical protein